MERELKWLTDVIPESLLGDISKLAKSIEVVEEPSAELCLICRGAKLLCGKSRCPVIVRAQSLAKLGDLPKTNLLDGSSPPGIFIGRIGYPKVYIGPMLPPYHGNTSILDTPELWLGKPIDEIVKFRYSLIRGKVKASVFDVQKGGKVVDEIQELAMAKIPIDIEVELEKAPRRIITLSDDSQPFGPSAPLKRMKASSNIKVDYRIEKAYYDYDLKASDAVFELYQRGVKVSSIQRAFSAGIFGLKSLRKFVPTRWSITAVDSLISLQIIKEVKHLPTINEYLVYKFKSLDNLFVALLFPEPWKFEWIEAWYPNTTWNPYGLKPELMGDYEDYWGRSSYALVGGCYYAARLATAEHLAKMRRQAACLLLREIHPGYVLPVGVWNAREGVRAMFKQKAERYTSLDKALKSLFSKLSIKKERWIEASTLLKRALFQRKITEFKG
jgi:hypothetical protein